MGLLGRPVSGNHMSPLHLRPRLGLFAKEIGFRRVEFEGDSLLDGPVTIYGVVHAESLHAGQVISPQS
ncbi:hypothetical protein J1N35_027342 [Gossypium stocksii]|uniref:Uncharacterized protein n=1 Tax=Gossypium stocksii TaxID=47602 RepID=A0A9D3V9J5_9ROSI|nr:hypothetical protein J1N35_027342 [Gossypium stocksii]